MQKHPLFTGVLLLFFLLSCLPSLQAQIQIGAKAGASANTFRVIGNNFFFSEGGTNPGVNAGFFGLVEGKGSPLALRVELLYAQKGGENRILVSDLVFSTDLLLHYLSVPVLLNVHRGNIYLEAGPEFSYLIKGSGKVVQGPDLGDVTDELDSRLDLSLALGMYYKWKKFQAGFRFLNGFSTVNTLEQVSFDGFRHGDEVFKNKSVQFWIGYTLLQK